MDKDADKFCIACGNSIPSQANVCDKCGNFQSHLKNNLRYLASVVGIISVFLGATTFFISSIPSVRQVIAWKDEVRVLTFASNKPITIVNTGDGDVFVTHINVTGIRPNERGFSTTERVGKLVEAGKVITLDHLSSTEGYTVAASTDPSEIENLRNAAELFSKSDACVRMIFAVPEDPGYTTFSEFFEKIENQMITYDVSATVQFFSIKKQEYVDQEIPMIGFLIIKDGCSVP